MVVVMNGMVLYGGVIFYSGIFLVFSDYCWVVIWLFVLMK